MKVIISSIVLALIMFTGSLSAAETKIRFSEVSKEAGITFVHEKATFHKSLENMMPWLTAGGAAVSVGDYNNDGLDDIYLTNTKIGSKNVLYRNDGNFRFTDVAEEVGLADVNNSKDTGVSAFALWFDYDNDGWKDILLFRMGVTALFKNNKGIFKEVTKEAGILRRINAYAGVVFDYDRDGDLDVYIGSFFPPHNFYAPKDTKVLMDSWESARNGGLNYLFMNNGDGTFTDVTDKAGVQDSGWANAVGHGDINNDGWQDLYLANDFGTDKMFLNMGDGTFEDISNDAIGIDTKKGMNAEFGDYDNDGYLDIYVTNMTEPYLLECNMLWRNNGDETFTDLSQETGSCDTDWGWGAKFLDADNDGDLDLFAANGFISAEKGEYMNVLLGFILKENVDLTDVSVWPPIANHSMAGYEANVLFEQTRNGFRSVGKPAGVASTKDSRGVAIADFDNDGKMDFVVSNVGVTPEVYRNVTKTNKQHWVQVRLTGDGKKSNRDAIGARIEVRTGLKIQIREIAGGNGFEAQSTLRAHFGLQSAKKIDLLTVIWPDGSRQEFRNVKVDRIYNLVQGGSLKDIDTVASSK